jgi:hypothetical protein
MVTQTIIKFVAGYTGIGILSYNFVGPVFDNLSGYMPPCLFKYVAYGALWPIPVSMLVCCVAHEMITEPKK